MRKPRRVPLILAAVAGFAASLLIPTAAQADYWGDETNYAVTANEPPAGEKYCAPLYTGVEACFVAYGDVFYVKDTKSDGYAAVGEWTWEDPSGNFRWGACVNKLGAGNWGKCNKNFSETGTGYLYGARYNSGNFVGRGKSVIFHS